MATKYNLDSEDCTELYYVLDSQSDLAEKIGPDGEALAAGEVDLSAADLAAIRSSLEDKLEALHAGHYDNYAGECKRARSCIGKWIQHLQNIMDALSDDAGSLDLVFYFVPALALLSALRGTFRTLSK